MNALLTVILRLPSSGLLFGSLFVTRVSAATVAAPATCVTVSPTLITDPNWLVTTNSKAPFANDTTSMSAARPLPAPFCDNSPIGVVPSILRVPVPVATSVASSLVTRIFVTRGNILGRRLKRGNFCTNSRMSLT